jgi:hypothetical protein
MARFDEKQVTAQDAALKMLEAPSGKISIKKKRAGVVDQKSDCSQEFFAMLRKLAIVIAVLFSLSSNQAFATWHGGWAGGWPGGWHPAWYGGWGWRAGWGPGVWYAGYPYAYAPYYYPYYGYYNYGYGYCSGSYWPSYWDCW